MNNEKIVNICFVVGLQGTGHHLFEATCSFNNEETSHLVFHELLLRYFEYGKNPDIKAFLKNQEMQKKIINNFINDKISDKNTFNFLEMASFPYGMEYNGSDTLRRFDIIQFYELFGNHPNINLFFVVTTRDIISTVLSGWERKFAYTLDEMCKITEDNLLFINSQLQLIPKDKYIIVDYDDLCNNINKFEEILRKVSDLSDISMDETKVKNSSRIIDYDNIEVKYIKSYFNDMRLKQFSFIQDNIYKLSN